MNSLSQQCLVCDRTEQQVPLIQLQYRGQPYWICPEHLPILIHKPETLAGKLPGAAYLLVHNHDED